MPLPEHASDVREGLLLAEVAKQQLWHRQEAVMLAVWYPTDLVQTAETPWTLIAVVGAFALGFFLGRFWLRNADGCGHDITCSPRTEPLVLRVSTFRKGKEIIDEDEVTWPGADRSEASGGQGVGLGREDARGDSPAVGGV